MARFLPASRLFSGHIDSNVKLYSLHSLAILQPDMLFHVLVQTVSLEEDALPTYSRLSW